MNNATLIGLFAGLGLVALAIGLGGDASAFLNARAFLIVFGRDGGGHTDFLPCW